MRVVCLVLGLGLIACSFDPRGLAPDEHADAASMDAEVDPDSSATEDAADLDALIDADVDGAVDASPVDASPVDAPIDGPACGAPGQPCCSEGEACTGLGLCVLGTCVV